MTLLRSKLLATTVIAGLTILVPGIALAQDAPASSTQTNQDDEDKNDDSASEVEAVVVTGSRIRRNEFTSSAPIQVITAEQSTLEGLVDTTEILQQSSVAAGSFQVNNQLTGFVTTGGPGANTISLRGLGATRTLVLLNGRRVGPAGTRGTVGPVDLNVIPNSIVERFEILKDGASSIYGSDAVAGVINIITKQNLDGLELNAFATQSQGGGGETYRLSGAWGTTFDRGYFNVAADYYDQKVLRRGDRDDTSCTQDYLFDATTRQRVDYQNTDPGQPGDADGTYKCLGLFTRVLRTSGTNNFGDLIYADPGVTYPGRFQGNSGGRRCLAPTYTVCTNVTNGSGNEAIPVAGLVRQRRAGFPDTFPYAHMDDPVQTRASIISPVKRYTIFSTAGFDLSDNVEAYGEFLWNRRESVQYGARQFFPTFANANPNNPFGTTLGTGAFTPIIPLKSDRAQEVDYWRAVVGLRGDFTGSLLNGWSWDVYAQKSSSDATYSTDIIYNDRVLAVTGASACNQALITISGGQCSSLASNTPSGGIPFLSSRVINGDFNAAERAFLFTNESGNTTYEQEMVEASITGDLFDLPAGTVGAAFGVTYRHDAINDTPGFNERTGNLWGSTSAGITKGDDTVREAFAEVELPLMKGMPLIESLDLQASGRYTDYESFGSDTTWKAGLNWQITPNWRVRATKGTSFRAPALYELYLANQTSFTGQVNIDPCIQYELSSDTQLQANCAAGGVPTGYTAAGTSSATVITGGGAGVLRAETSVAETVGLIWTPDFIDLSIAVDYFDITVNNEIAQFGAANIVGSCYRSPQYANNPFCTLFTRNADPNLPNTPPANSAGANAIVTVNNSYVNVAEQVNRGIDLTARYQHEFDFGKLTLDGQFTWQTHDTTQLFGNFAPSDYNGATYNFDGPDFTGNLNIRFDRGDWTAFWGMDILGKASDSELVGDLVGSTVYTNQCVGFATCNDALAAGAGTPTPIARTLYRKRFTEMTVTHDLSFRKKMDTWTFQGGVLNVFDDRPPSLSGGFRIGTAALNGYDMIGRRVFVSISKRW
jgi:iron complex outermembrane receptor protein